MNPELLKVISAPAPDIAPLPPAVVHPSGVRELRALPYAEVEGSRPLELDLWLPPDQGSTHPLVLFVHGGAWRRGRRDDMGLRTRGWDPGPFARMASAGLAVATADYRLSGEAPFPAPLDDLRSALRWLTLRRAELGIDPGRTVVWGESAGGHLASLLALTRPGPALAGAVIWYGPSDLTAAGPGTPEALLLGADPATVRERAEEASPLTHAHAAAPPFLLVHGEQDAMVPREHSERLAARLAEAGAEAELWTVPGSDHVWYGLPDDQVETVFTRSLRFATDRLLPPGRR
ncbi:alpha/beta hydrolase fold domain-containing protein [Streptomyces sp. NPDC005899]|uniref:alpha/beta hydrolase fold domain-containing protein n=1 Tax=Streptomyces sp. NPDC005899 TaxID=3155716 RepID=UPI0033C5D4DC